jgi:hypothetical protein
MEAADFSKTPVRIYQTTWCYVPEDSNLQGDAVKTSTLNDHIHVALVLRLLTPPPPCQYTSLLNLHTLIFDLTLFGGLCALLRLEPTYSITSYRNIILFIYSHFLKDTTRA